MTHCDEERIPLLSEFSMLSLRVYMHRDFSNSENKNSHDDDCDDDDGECADKNYNPTSPLTTSY
jgi:hypothetical protein